jgi:hypothetical protein
MSVRAVVAGVAVAGLSLAVAACSSGSSSSSGSNPSGTANQLTGSQLTRSLLPASDFPSSFAVDSQSTTDSGGTLEKSTAIYDVNTLSCNDYDNDFLSAGFGETAFSSDSVANNSVSQSYGQIVYQFPTTSAASRFFSGLKSLTSRCGSYTETGGGSSSKMGMKLEPASPVGGDQAFWQDRQTTISGTSAQINVLFALDGADLVGIAASGVGSAPPSAPAPTDLLAKLITSISSAH